MKYSNTKIRLLAVEQILLNNHYGISLKSIKDILDYRFEIKSDRKAIYDDIYALSRFYDVQMIARGNTVIYKMEALNGNN